ncbi:MAG: hypothetical protein QOE93_1798 [Actinomycetota bacterium]|nr:hypothetical protein [Actinomycetota bacterium]
MSSRGNLLDLLVTHSSDLFIDRLLRRHHLPARYALLWLSVGAVLIFLAAFPGVLDATSDWMGITYGPTTFFLGAITLLLLVVVHFSWEVSRLEVRTRLLAEELALLRAEAPAGPGAGADREGEIARW